MQATLNFNGITHTNKEAGVLELFENENSFAA